jgi:hypothetical protein
MRSLILALLLLPAWAQGSVVVSEVAWMGSADSPNDEWLELYNAGGEDVDLAGWTLSDGASVSITLSGTLGSNRYAVLERTDDGSAPGAAFLIYTGALPNTGATLTLRNAAGTVIDSVVGGSDWQQIGGSNESKETAQRRQSGWYTAAATPGTGAWAGTAADTPPAATPEPSPPPNTTSPNPSATPRTTRETQGGGDPAVVLHRTPRPLFNEIEGPAQVLLRQPANFSILTGGVSDTILASLSHTWNFGDGTTATGEAVTHHYQYPGRYLVVVESQYKDYESVTRHEVEVRSLPLSLARTNTAITVTNDAPYELTLSGFTLRAQTAHELPAHTTLLPGGSLHVPVAAITARPEDLVALFDASGQLVASVRPAIAPVIAAPSARVGSIAGGSVPPPRVSTAAASISVPPVNLLTPALAALTARHATASLPVASSAAPLVAAASAAPVATQSASYLGLLLVLLVAVVGVLSRSRA